MKERFIIRSFPTAHGQTNQFEEINEIQDVFHVSFFDHFINYLDIN